MSRSHCQRDREFLRFPSQYTPRRLTGYSAGGVFIVGGQGKIEINNTFEERLRLLEIDALPAVRETLFGKNQNRKFYD